MVIRRLEEGAPSSENPVLREVVRETVISFVVEQIMGELSEMLRGQALVVDLTPDQVRIRSQDRFSIDYNDRDAVIDGVMERLFDLGNFRIEIDYNYSANSYGESFEGALPLEEERTFRITMNRSLNENTEEIE